MNNSTADRRLPLGLFPGQPTPRLYDRVAELVRTRHYSRRTEEAYVHWIRRFILFQARTHPRELAEGDVNRFLTHLAIKVNVAASTQDQALAALLFLYEHVWKNRWIGPKESCGPASPKRLPAVLTRDEVEAVLAQLDGCSTPGLHAAVRLGCEAARRPGVAGQRPGLPAR